MTRINSQILWGSGYLNVLKLGRPIYNVVTGWEARDGSEWAKTTAGAGDSWIVGRDFVQDFEMRFVPEGSDGATYTSWSGPAGVEAFLAWARDSNTFRFVADDAYPSAYIDGCYLADPFRGAGQVAENVALSGVNDNGRRTMALRIQNPTYSFGLALRGLFMEYAPQSDYTKLSPLPTFSRASVAYATANDLGIASKAVNALRDQHYTSAGVRTTLLEAARSPGWTFPEALDNAAWTKTNATVTANATTAPDGAATADALIDTAANVTHEFSRATPALTNNTKSTVSLFARPTGRSWFRIATLDKAGTTRSTWFNVTTGVVGTKDANHVVTITPSYVSGAAAFYRVSVTFDSAAGGTAPVVTVAMATADGGAAYLGDGVSGIYFWGMQFETDGASMSSYMNATARSADSLTVPLSSAMQKPQASWWYAKFIEQGTVIGTGTSGLLGVGASANAALLIFNNGSGFYSAMHRRTSDVASTMAAAPAYGDTVELLALLFADGSVQLKQSINGAADVSAAASAANTLATTWSTTTLTLNSRGAGTDGFTGLIDVKIGAGTAVNTMALARAA